MIKALLDYQEKDAELREIELTLSGSEERKKALSAKKYLDGVEASINKLDLKAAELSSAYEKCLADFGKLKEQENEFKTAAEEAEDMNAIDYLGKKTDELLGQIRTLSATVARREEEIKGVIAEFAQTKKKTAAAQVQYKENAPKYAELKNSLKEKQETAKKELDGLKSKVDPALMERYLKKRASFYPVIYEIKGNACGFCSMQLSMSEAGKLKNGEIIECEHCGRLLFTK